MQITHIKDGDTIVIHSDGALSAEAVKKLKRTFKREFPKAKCIVLDAGMSYSIVSPDVKVG